MRNVTPTVVLAVALAACGDIVDPALPDERLSDGLFLYAALYADSVRHWVQVSPLDGQVDEFEATVTIHERTASSHEPWRLLGRYSAEAPPRGPIVPKSEQKPCRGGPYRSATTLCMGPEAVLEPGGTYKITAMSEGYQSASGVTTIPGDFMVTEAEMSTTDGVYALTVAWSRADAVHRYVLGTRRIRVDCTNCSRAWTVELDSTRYSGTLPAVVVDSLGSTPTVEVMAADEHLHAFITTGLGGRLLTVQPVQNVKGGFGVVGSARYRTRRIVMPGG